MDGVGDPIANSRVSCWHVSCPFSLLVIRQAAVVPCPSIDHVVPRSRGGDTNWENCVIADKRVNTRKADKTPDEAGLKLLREPGRPREVPVTILLKNMHGIPDWDPFLIS